MTRFGTPLYHCYTLQFLAKANVRRLRGPIQGNGQFLADKISSGAGYSGDTGRPPPPRAHPGMQCGGQISLTCTQQETVREYQAETSGTPPEWKAIALLKRITMVWLKPQNRYDCGLLQEWMLRMGVYYETRWRLRCRLRVSVQYGRDEIYLFLTSGVWVSKRLLSSVCSPALQRPKLASERAA